MNAPASLRNPITPWENEIWTPDPALFKGETVFCVASGPSFTQGVADKLKGHRVIAVNSSAKLLPFADVLYFTDSGWYEMNRDFVKAWPGLIVSMSRAAKRELDDPKINFSGTPRVLRVRGIGAPPFPPRQNGKAMFPPLGSEGVQQGRNSGNTAVGVAIALGASRVALVGFDCRVVNGREHCHDEYLTLARDLELYNSEFLRAFDGWNEAALASDVGIINCTPGSAIKEFPFVELEEVL